MKKAKVITKERNWLESEPWKGETAYVIGGGPSLRQFDWRRLHKENTIGCNDAYKLGRKVAKICIFGDYTWFKKHHDRLIHFGGIIVTSACALAPGNTDAAPWVHYYNRIPNGLHRDGLGWNGNTGATAINLALLLGAETIYLLGFDMGRIGGKSNWHDEIIHPNAVLPGSYQIFKDREPMMVSGLKKFPGQTVININDKDTMPGIKRIGFTDWVKNG